MRPFVLAAAIAATVMFAQGAAADSYPSRPITMIVPFGAGGPTDVIARIVAQRMSESLGQPVVVENISGAAGTIATGKVVHAPPDGYTLSIGHYGTHAVNALVYSLPYDLVRDLAPIALLTSSPYLIVSSTKIPATDLKGLIGWLKAHPDQAVASFNGPGSAGQLLSLKFQSITGVHFRFAAYRGGDSATVPDVLAARLPMKFAQPADSLSFIQSGQMRAYAVTADKRLTASPEVPTVDEAGLPDFHVAVWHGLWVPKGTPQPVIAKLNTAVRDALADAAVRKRLANIGQDIPPAAQQTPEALRAQQQVEIEKWRPIIQAEHIKAD
ncbi:MAG TPA: tripartite tricarboxylate transporter substrate-binding protein [Pseudolabrys sp.]|nr:tripartite tricarboxylate transporter substrate-binding protein [Pseudolabrys sp.]